MIIVDKETFEAEVQQSSMPCVVDLWGPQCGPCLALMPEVEKLAEAGFPATPCPSKPSRPKRTNSSNVCGQRAVMVCSILTQP